MNHMREAMKTVRNILLLVVVAVMATGCMENLSRQEREQADIGISSIIANQPVPDLGGYSFERQVVIDTYVARNATIATYTYAFTLQGEIVEICASIGYPIPYSTQLTNPLRIEGGGYVVNNPEPNGLYPPVTADATLVQCVNPDGSVSPTYWEPVVMGFPYRIKSDIQLERLEGDPSFSIQVP